MDKQAFNGNGRILGELLEYAHKRAALRSPPAAVPLAGDAVLFLIRVKECLAFWTEKRQRLARTLHQPEEAGDSPTGKGIRYIVWDEPGQGRMAAQALAEFELPPSELEPKVVASDNYRWNDWVPKVYDWASAWLATGEKSLVNERYTRYVDTFAAKPWGGPGMEANNYFWGYFRNEVLWAVACRDEVRLRAALDMRLPGFLSWAAGPGRGGVCLEGSEYGPYQLGYFSIPLAVLEDLGRDLAAETNWWTEAVYAAIYNTLPATYTKDPGQTPYAQVFPTNDQERWGGYPAAGNSGYGDFMAWAAAKWAGQPIGDHARAWLEAVQPELSPEWRLTQLPGGNASAPAELPLDYYAPGPGYAYCRDRWDSGIAILLQLGQVEGVGHLHYDTGSFQIWSAGRWLTKETSGYQGDASGVPWAALAEAHNTVSVDGHGPTPISRQLGPPVVYGVQRSQTTLIDGLASGWLWAGVDLTPIYRSLDPVYDYSALLGLCREFVFLREYGVLLVITRVESTRPVDVASFTHWPMAPARTAGGGLEMANVDRSLQESLCWPVIPFPIEQVEDLGSWDGLPDGSPWRQWRSKTSVRLGSGECLIQAYHAIRPDSPVLMIESVEGSAGRIALRLEMLDADGTVDRTIAVAVLPGRGVEIDGVAVPIRVSECVCTVDGVDWPET